MLRQKGHPKLTSSSGSRLQTGSSSQESLWYRSFGSIE